MLPPMRQGCRTLRPQTHGMRGTTVHPRRGALRLCVTRANLQGPWWYVWRLMDEERRDAQKFDFLGGEFLQDG